VFQLSCKEALIFSFGAHIFWTSWS